jgi:hypothetical protein
MAMNDRQDSKSPNTSAAAAALKTGARNDDSSLFSLDRIRQAEESATRASRERDDSGLIDLHALAALSGTAPAQVTTAPLVVSTSAGLFGAPAVSPASAPVAPAPAAADEANPFASSSKRKTPLLVLGGVIAVGAAVAAFMGMQGSGTTPATADATATMAPAITAAAPTPVPAAAPPPEPQIVAATPGQRAPAAEAPKAAAPVAVAKASGPAKAAAPKPAAAPAAAPKEAPKPAGPVCDLTCQMQKAVSKPK